jgi:hypothetical protein
MLTSVIVMCVDTTVQIIQLKTEPLIEYTLIGYIRKYDVFNFSGPDHLSLPVGYLLYRNLLRAAYTRCFEEVDMSVIEIGRQSRAFLDFCVYPCEPSCAVCSLSAADSVRTLITLTDNTADKCVPPLDGDVYLET